MAIRVTRTIAEVGGFAAPNIRITRTLAEVAGATSPSIRVTRTLAEVAGTPTQADIRLYRFEVLALVEISSAEELDSSDTVTFSQSVASENTLSLDSTDTVTFSQDADLDGVFAEDASNTITFTQTAEGDPDVDLVAENTVTFSQVSIPSIFTQPLDSTVTFTQLANLQQTVESSISDTVTFSQTATALGPVAVEQTVTFTQAAGAGLIIPGGLVKTAIAPTVTFSQSVAKVLLLAGGQDLTALDGTITFTHRAVLPIFKTVPQAVVFTDSAVGEKGWVLVDTVTFSDVGDPDWVWDRTVTQTITFNHAHIYEKDIDLCGYSPIVGGGTDPNAPTPPPSSLGVVARASQVTLYYPTVSPTTTVAIRAPEYGDRYKLQFDRINRETRGGTLEVYSDPTWPKLEILEVSFTGLKESEVQAVLDFFTATLGLEVGFTDWFGRTWHGIIVTPDAELVRPRRNIVDFSFEFEGELQ